MSKGAREERKRGKRKTKKREENRQKKIERQESEEVTTGREREIVYSGRHIENTDSRILPTLSFCPCVCFCDFSSLTHSLPSPP